MIEDETFIEGMQTRIMSDQEMDTMYIPDVEYMNIDGISRVLQILVPRKRVMENEKYPLIVYVQGSAWHKQNVYQHVGQLNYLCKQGFVVAIVQYRESDLAPFPAQIEDTKTAIRFLRKHHEEYFIDEQNVFLFGDSSGGHVALVSGLTAKLPLFNGNLYSEYSNEVRAIIDFYGVVDITMEDGFPTTGNHQQPDSPEGYLIGRKNVLEHLDIARQTSPMTYLAGDIPPILIAHGTKDRLVAFKQSVKLYKALKDKNKEVIFPDPLLVKVQGRDTILPDFQERKYKILNYIDTSGCTECRMKLAEWQLLKQEIDSLGYDVDILFVAWVHNYDELEILQRANRCQLPFLYDPQGDMQKINQFPAEPAFQTFLLDSLNRVLLIGSPVENDKIWTLYQRSLSSLNSGIPGRNP